MDIIRTTREAEEAFKNEISVALDIETTGLSPYRDIIAVTSLCGLKTGKVAVLHHMGGEPFPNKLFSKPTLEVVTHNGAMFDLLFFRNNGIRFHNHYDTLIGELVLATNGRRGVRKNLGATMKRRTGQDSKLEIDHSAWSAHTLTEDQLIYAATDVLYLHDIQKEQVSKAKERFLTLALEKEQALSLLCVEATHRGIHLDFERYSYFVNQMIEKANESRARVAYVFGEDFNVRSPKQVLENLQLIGLKIESTRVDELALIARDMQIVEDILTVRQSDKRAGMYSPEWYQKYVTNNRVHARYWQLGTDTTRFSSSDPNMQQIPRNMREMFGGEEGKVIIGIDYAQAELRMAASIANSPSLMKALQADDVHNEMAAVMFEMDPLEVTYEQRQDGKTGSFDWVFGGGADGLRKMGIRQRKDISEAKARKMLRNLNERFPEVHAWHENARLLASKSRYGIDVKLPWGHRRMLTGTQRVHTKVCNTKVQGSVAIIIKEAMLELFKYGLYDYVGGCVHDEITFTSVPENEAQELAVEAAKVIEDASLEHSLIKFPTDTAISKYWST